MKNNTRLTSLLVLLVAFAMPLTANAEDPKTVVRKIAPKAPVAKPTVAKPAAPKAASSKSAAAKATASKAAAKKPVVIKVTNSAFVMQSDEVQGLAGLFKGGKFNCEFNNSVTITPNQTHLGYFTLTHKGSAANVLVVPTNTGALRLENKASGFVWLQLPTKSMLMNSKIGQRLADDCQLVQ